MLWCQGSRVRCASPDLTNSEDHALASGPVPLVAMASRLPKRTAGDEPDAHPPDPPFAQLPRPMLSLEHLGPTTDRMSRVGPRATQQVQGVGPPLAAHLNVSRNVRDAVLVSQAG